MWPGTVTPFQRCTKPAPQISCSRAFMARPRSTMPGAVHLDLHPGNMLLGPAGPVVIDWRNATEGSPELDPAVTALIMALIASDREHPMRTPAAELLSAFAHLANGDLRSGLPGAAQLRRVDPTSRLMRRPGPRRSAWRGGPVEIRGRPGPPFTSRRTRTPLYPTRRSCLYVKGSMA